MEFKNKKLGMTSFDQLPTTACSDKCENICYKRDYDARIVFAATGRYPWEIIMKTRNPFRDGVRVHVVNIIYGESEEEVKIRVSKLNREWGNSKYSWFEYRLFKPEPVHFEEH